MRIEITGPIGSGKTTLAGALASQPGWQIACEVPEKIPFWAETYNGCRAYQFEKDVSFLLFHGVNVRELQGDLGGTLICDFSFVQDLAYARMGQDEAELDAYESVYRHITAQCGYPDVIINLRCSTPILLTRIAARGRGLEHSVTGEFLDHLVEQIDGLLATHRQHFKVVEIDSEAIDFIAAPERIVAQITPLLGGVAA